MDNRTEAREFLVSRRANLSPEQAGLIVSGHRRVPGLRRGEVAMLADVSPEYYATIERGHLAGVSDAVLEAVARALQLDDAEREHLFDLARVANGAAQPVRKRRPKTWAARESLNRALDVIDRGPAFVRNGRMDVLATNTLGRAFYDEVLDGPGQGNLELSTLSDAFRTRWGAHNVRRPWSGTKLFVHHDVGEITLTYEGMELTAEPGLSFLIYTAEPGTPSQERLDLLASLAATNDQQHEIERGTSCGRGRAENEKESRT